MKQLLSEISKASLNLVFPIYCEGCGAKLAYDNKTYLCQNCKNQVKRNRPPFCIRCGRSLSGDEDIKTVCPECVGKFYYFDAAWQCAAYDGLMKELIHNFKYNRKLFLKHALSETLHDFAKTYIDFDTIDLVMPVPMHPGRLAKRGFNQSALLANELSRLLGIPLNTNSLAKVKDTRKQIVLNKKERLHNLKGAFSIKKGAQEIISKHILLVDDVFTTGATANECSKVLKVYGVEKVYMLAIARGI